MTEFSKYMLGEHDQDIELSTSSENLDAAVSLFTQARQSIYIYTHCLDPKIFNQSACIDALKSFVLKNNAASIKILIRNPGHTMRSGHRLISLARHLSSYIEIRVIHEDYSSAPDAFLLIDQRAMLLLQDGERYDGVCNFNNPRLSTELAHRFTEVWNHSAGITEFRQIVI